MVPCIQVILVGNIQSFVNPCAVIYTMTANSLPESKKYKFLITAYCVLYNVLIYNTNIALNNSSTKQHKAKVKYKHKNPQHNLDKRPLFYDTNGFSKKKRRTVSLISLFFILLFFFAAALLFTNLNILS